MADASPADLAFFRDHPLTRGFTDEELERLEDRVERVEIPTGAPLCEQGQKTRGLYFVRSGDLRVTQRQRDDTRELTITDLAAPTVVGEMELLSNRDAVATVMTITPAVTFLLSHASFRDLMSGGESVIAKMVRNVALVLANRLVEANARYLSVVDPTDYGTLSEALTGCWE